MSTFIAIAPFTVAVTALVGASSVRADDARYGPELQGFDYPYPVSTFTLKSQGEDLKMAYMDVKPTAAANGRIVVMLHGKNFCSASWESAIPALTNAGYRVIAIDQVGFCKSTKPAHYQYTFQQLATNTRALLQSLDVLHFTLVAHSTGGMIAVRYSLMHPGDIEQLVLVSPIGLEDWKAKGVPSLTVDQWYARERKTNADTIRNYERGTYYAGTWRPEFEKWVQMYAGEFVGSGGDLVAWNSALVYDMIYTQPIIYELGDLRVPVLMISGDKDNTTLGKGFAPPEVLSKLGHYTQLAKEAVRKIPGGQLVEYADLGHASWIQDPTRFNKTLLDALGRHGAAR
jgi:pimeloyl-ACP methyl ester carboxylesterase